MADPTGKDVYNFQIKVGVDFIYSKCFRNGIKSIDGWLY